ncbi:MAG: YbaB/EbfC family nucleoid-associated protein [Crocinitomicaceae bacterium]|nr:YbaB/EbfC family nucleoid-associated protein [Crocinitomicaceae bacterium]
MFGGDMMQKLQEMQKQMEESKKKLDTIKVEEIIEGKLKIVANGNRKIESIEIINHQEMEQEELEDYLIMAMNRVMEKASNVHDSEMASSAKGLIPGMM